MEVFLESTEHLRLDSILEFLVEITPEFMEHLKSDSILESITEATEELSLGPTQEQRVRCGTEPLPRWAQLHRRQLHGERRALVRLRRHGLHLRVQCLH